MLGDGDSLRALPRRGTLVPVVATLTRQKGQARTDESCVLEDVCCHAFLRRPSNSPSEGGLDLGYSAIFLSRNLVALVPIDPDVSRTNGTI